MIQLFTFHIWRNETVHHFCIKYTPEKVSPCGWETYNLLGWYLTPCYGIFHGRKLRMVFLDRWNTLIMKYRPLLHISLMRDVRTLKKITKTWLPAGRVYRYQNSNLWIKISEIKVYSRRYWEHISYKICVSTPLQYRLVSDHSDMFYCYRYNSRKYL